MALISCPECGRQVSDRAAACPDCGYPIAASNPSGIASIKIGDIYGSVPRGALAAAVAANIKAFLVDYNTQEVLGEGKTGMVLKLNLNAPRHVQFRWNKPNGTVMFDGNIEPRKRYELVRIPSIWAGKWALNEIDVIDSGW